jgi:hypothetical protein
MPPAEGGRQLGNDGKLGTRLHSLSHHYAWWKRKSLFILFFLRNLPISAKFAKVGKRPGI